MNVKDEHMFYIDESDDLNKLSYSDICAIIDKIHVNAYIDKLLATPAIPINKIIYNYNIYDYGTFPIYLLYRYLYPKKIKEKKLSRKELKKIEENEIVWNKFLDCFNGCILSPKEWDFIIENYWPHYQKTGELL